jgi:multidrug efflux pump subunit AcrA (membrane-fusion protein)
MKKLTILVSLFLAAAVLIGCGAKTSGTSEATPTPAAHTIIAEGHLVPNRSLYLSFLASGRVEEVLVARGDQVSSGQVLVQLGDRQQAEAALAGARLEQVSAQQAYDALSRTDGLTRAQSWQAYLQAQKARAAAQIAWDQLDPVTLQTNIDDAQAVVTDRQTDLEDAQKDFDKYKSLDQNNGSRKNSEKKLQAAQLAYDQAVQKLEALNQHRDLLRASLDAALAAEAEALHTYQLSQDGPNADQLALAQARLDQANANTAAAQSALDNYTLKAPFAGTVAEVNVVADQMIGPETWAVALADTSLWYVDTSDLAELDVVDVQVGQAVTVTVDALPELVLNGVVETVSAAPKMQSGDILYTVRIRLVRGDPRLRWGMTVEATFINP